MSKNAIILLSIVYVLFVSCTTHKVVFADKTVTLDEEECTILIKDTFSVKYNSFIQTFGKIAFLSAIEAILPMI